jgi:hypothetical protein
VTSSGRALGGRRGECGSRPVRISRRVAPCIVTASPCSAGCRSRRFRPASSERARRACCRGACSSDSCRDAAGSLSERRNRITCFAIHSPTVVSTCTDSSGIEPSSVGPMFKS